MALNTCTFHPQELSLRGQALPLVLSAGKWHCASVPTGVGCSGAGRFYSHGCLRAKVLRAGAMNSWDGEFFVVGAALSF
jgi:hypothetical protein